MSEFDLMTPDLEALQEVFRVHEELDPPDTPIILSNGFQMDTDPTLEDEAEYAQ